MEDWNQDRLIVLLEVLIDYRGKTPRKVNSGIPLITAKIVKNGRIDTPTEFLPIEDYENWMVRGFPKIDDVLLTTEAPLGEVAQVDDEKIALAQRIVCLRGKKGILDNTFLKYYFLSPKGRLRLKARETGTTVTGIKQSELKEVLIDYPPYEIQLQIAKVLSSIDSKIELNRRINGNLEQQAQALFNHYFIERPDLLGKYKIGNLTEIANYLNGLAMQKFRPQMKENGIPVLKIKELGQGYTDASSDICSENIADEYKVHNGDVIFSWSGTLMVKIWCGGLCGLNQHLFKVTSEIYPKWFYYFWTKHHLNKFIRIAQDKAVTMGHIKRRDLEVSEILIPQMDILAKLDAIINPLFSQIIEMKCENRNLATIRDILLPRLMSGTLKIDDLNR